MSGAEFAASDDAFEQRVGAVRRFTRFYTRRIGLLDEGLLKTQFSLTQGRVLYELAQRREATATSLAAALAIDHGYLSRILRSFEERDLIVRRRDQNDGRQVVLSLTTKGRELHAALVPLAQTYAQSLAERLSPDEQAALQTAFTKLAARAEPHVL